MKSGDKKKRIQINWPDGFEGYYNEENAKSMLAEIERASHVDLHKHSDMLYTVIPAGFKIEKKDK